MEIVLVKNCLSPLHKIRLFSHFKKISMRTFDVYFWKNWNPAVRFQFFRQKWVRKISVESLKIDIFGYCIVAWLEEMIRKPKDTAVDFVKYPLTQKYPQNKIIQLVFRLNNQKVIKLDIQKIRRNKGERQRRIFCKGDERFLTGIGSK